MLDTLIDMLAAIDWAGYLGGALFLAALVFAFGRK